MTRRAKKGLAAAIGLLSMGASMPVSARPLIIAHRGLYQTFDHTSIDRIATCTAARIRQPVHPFLENTIASLREAARIGADWIEIDVAPTKDKALVVFHDWTLDCRTDGRGDVREHTLAELKTLDVGYGYTADGGISFPFRGKGTGLMPTLEEVLHALPRQRLLINFKSRDPADADAVSAAFRRAGVAIDKRYAFYGGTEPVLARMRALAPYAWIWDNAESCSRRFQIEGWTAAVEHLCRGGVIGVTLDRTQPAEAWHALFAKIRKAGTRVVLFGEAAPGEGPLGLQRAEQLTQLPHPFEGYVWVEDLWAVMDAGR